MTLRATSGFERRLLGRTGLTVSALGLGTVELGMDYGIRVPGDSGKPGDETSVTLLRMAADHGVNFFDTAPGYEAAEGLLGEAITARPGCVVATKVGVPSDANGRPIRGKGLHREIAASLARSRHALRRENLDVVQIHNATLDVLAEGEITRVLADARDRNELRFIGASVYNEAQALAAIADENIDMLQVPYSLLDRRMEARVFPAARQARVGIVVRSALLKGVLTSKARSLPSDLMPLADAADRVRRALDVSWERLPGVALRFCLSSPDVATVILGVRTVDELETAVAATADGPLPEAAVHKSEEFALTNERLMDPSKWESA